MTKADVEAWAEANGREALEVSGQVSKSDRTRVQSGGFVRREG